MARSTPIRSSALAVLLLGLSVQGHTAGFHKRLMLQVSRTALDGVLTMDVDSGERCAALRAGADLDHDGTLDAAERQKLKDRLTTMATRALVLDISGAKVAVVVKSAKLNLRDDFTAGTGGVSLALLLEMVHPYAVTPGMSLTVEDTAPDFSHVEIEVQQVPGADAGLTPASKGSLEPGQKLKVRLEALGKRL